ncbi:MAG: type II toxin-antitoxin system RelE/ParE family toxin [Pseudomonadota bacterium]|nr:type II toxin-antitoxin system RelE/ParE family toxin [Pseudomonadota bacterium]MDP1906280.1 type II toxin-antitoxin system RelE/ParE family toxin [Pseudomonadota bacterium]MDP2351647.1 type II toxin-antitoxin system RelE/ParE family toxin [Pseudomonadota bacterium]
MRIEWSIAAGEDLRGIKAFIAKENPVAAARVIRAIRQSTLLLLDNPLIGRAGEITATRELVIDRLPYLVIYRIQENRLRILAVFHTSQYWQAGFGRA